MNQMGFSKLEFAAKKKRRRRERLPDQIEAATLWAKNRAKARDPEMH